MRANGYIGDRDYALASEAPVAVAQGSAQSVEAPYFVDLVDDALQSKFQDADFQSNAFRVYTTLDMRLQRAAAEAIRMGMASVDEQIKKQRRFRGQTPPEPQVALVAIDPHTGAVRALAGGRNYGMSQLDHILAKRQPGSIFKPFVYAAAMDTGVEGGSRILTPSTIVDDSPTTFWFDEKPYQPSNFEKKFYGDVTLRDALAHSLNVATVKVAEMVGYDNVVAMAHRAGMNDKILADSRGGAGIVRNHAARSRRRVHHVRQRRRLREAQLHFAGPFAGWQSDLSGISPRPNRRSIRAWPT